MATPTLLDWAATQGNQQTEISKSLIKQNAFLQLAPAEAVSGLEKRVGRIINRPTVTGRGFNEGKPSTKTTRTNQFYKIGLYEDRSEVDSAYLRTHTSPSEYRLSEDLQKLESVRDGYMTDYFYGDTESDPNAYNGFITYADLLNASFINGAPIVLDGGSSSASVQSSAYAIKLGNLGSQVLFNENSGSTPTMKDMGQQKVLDSGGTDSFFADTTMFTWDAGAQYNLAGIGRIANLVQGASAGSGGITVDLLGKLITFMKYKPDIIIVNRGIKHDIDQLVASSIEYQDRSTNISEAVTTMNGVMIFSDDNVTQTEEVVV